MLLFFLTRMAMSFTLTPFFTRESTSSANSSIVVSVYGCSSLFFRNDSLIYPSFVSFDVFWRTSLYASSSCVQSSPSSTLYLSFRTLQADVNISLLNAIILASLRQFVSSVFEFRRKLLSLSSPARIFQSPFLQR